MNLSWKAYNLYSSRRLKAVRFTKCFYEQLAVQEDTDSFVPMSYWVTQYNGSKLKLLLLLHILKKIIWLKAEIKDKNWQEFKIPVLTFTIICTLFVENGHFIFSKFIDNEQLLPISKLALKKNPYKNGNKNIRILISFWMLDWGCALHAFALQLLVGPTAM